MWYRSLHRLDDGDLLQVGLERDLFLRPIMSLSALERTQFPEKTGKGSLFSDVKWPVFEPDCLPLCSAETKSSWS
jgi:hypothetical protein